MHGIKFESFAKFIFEWKNPFMCGFICFPYMYLYMYIYIFMYSSVRNRFEKWDRFSVYSFDQLIGSDRMIETCGKIIIFHIIYDINI